jgi:hypothetical protein
MKIIPTLIVTTAIAFVLIGAASVLVLDSRFVLGGVFLVASVSIVGLALLKARHSEQLPKGAFEGAKLGSHYSNFLLYAFAMGAASIWTGITISTHGHVVAGSAVIIIGLVLATLMFMRTIQKFRNHMEQLRDTHTHDSITRL